MIVLLSLILRVVRFSWKRSSRMDPCHAPMIPHCIVRLEAGDCRDDLFRKGLERRDLVHIRHIEDRMRESHLRELLGTTYDALGSIIPGKMHSAQGCFLDGVVIASQSRTTFFECIDCPLHVFCADPITDITGIRILSHHAQCLVRARTANHDTWMRV